MKLKNMVEVIENNNECVVLKVKDGHEFDLFDIGMSPRLRRIRLTKGKVQTCTELFDDGKTFSWHWGMGGHTLVSDGVSKEGRRIQNCIEYDFGIPVTWRHTCTGEHARKYFEMDREAYFRNQI